jgi:hypothetical protein
MLNAVGVMTLQPTPFSRFHHLEQVNVVLITWIMPVTLKLTKIPDEI